VAASQESNSLIKAKEINRNPTRKNPLKAGVIRMGANNFSNGLVASIPLIV
jgi:hypothetical protein